MFTFLYRVGQQCAPRPAHAGLQAPAPRRAPRAQVFFFFFITLGLELSDTKVYEPQIRALLGTASQYCEAVVRAGMCGLVLRFRI